MLTQLGANPQTGQETIELMEKAPAFVIWADRLVGHGTLSHLGLNVLLIPASQIRGGRLRKRNNHPPRHSSLVDWRLGGWVKRSDGGTDRLGLRNPD